MEKPCDNCGAVGTLTFDEFAASVVCQSCGKVAAGTDEWEISADATFEGASYTGVHYDRVSTRIASSDDGILTNGDQVHSDTQRSARMEMGFLETISACCAYLHLPLKVERQAGDIVRSGLRAGRLLSLGSRWGRLHKLQAAACVYISVRMNPASATSTLTEVAAAVDESCFALGAVFKKLLVALRLKLEVVDPVTCLPRAATQFPCLEGLPHKIMSEIFSATESVIAIGNVDMLIAGKAPLQVASAALAVAVQFCRGMVLGDDLEWTPLSGGVTSAQRLERSLQTAVLDRAARLPKWDGGASVTFLNERGELRRDYLARLVSVTPQDVPPVLGAPLDSSVAKCAMMVSSTGRVDLPNDRRDLSGASLSSRLPSHLPGGIAGTVACQNPQGSSLDILQSSVLGGGQGLLTISGSLIPAAANQGARPKDRADGSRTAQLVDGSDGSGREMLNGSCDGGPSFRNSSSGVLGEKLLRSSCEGQPGLCGAQEPRADIGARFAEELLGGAGGQVVSAGVPELSLEDTTWAPGEHASSDVRLAVDPDDSASKIEAGGILVSLPRLQHVREGGIVSRQGSITGDMGMAGCPTSSRPTTHLDSGPGLAVSPEIKDAVPNPLEKAPPVYLSSWVGTEDVLRVLYRPHERKRGQGRPAGPAGTVRKRQRHMQGPVALASAKTAAPRQVERGADDKIEDTEIDEYICGPAEVSRKMAILQKIEAEKDVIG
eukprot:jgi/Mesvir1/19211/Mv11520-RA.1